jgi:nitric oxide reductase subunit C
VTITKADTRRFFFIGTVVFTGVFIAMTIHTHTTIAARTHSDRLTEDVVRGLHVWGRYNCENCHTLLGEGAYFAPDLTQIVAQRGAPYLTAFLADPSRFYSHERDGRLMPTLGLSAAEIADVIAFLEWVGGIDTNGWPPRPILVSGAAPRGLPYVEGTAASDDPVTRGKALFDGAAACATCHSRTQGLTQIGPTLAGIARTARERVADSAYAGKAQSADTYLRESILQPSAFVVPGANYAAPDGQSLMPSMYEKTLKPQDIDDLVAYLRSLE